MRIASQLNIYHAGKVYCRRFVSTRLAATLLAGTLAMYKLAFVSRVSDILYFSISSGGCANRPVWRWLCVEFGHPAADRWKRHNPWPSRKGRIAARFNERTISIPDDHPV
jgi:hypothetical protein